MAHHSNYHLTRSRLSLFFKTPAIFTHGWIKWLNEYVSDKRTQNNPDKVTELYNGATTTAKFEKLMNSTNLVFIFARNYTLETTRTFSNPATGIQINEDLLYYVARSGMKYWTSVEIDLEKLFKDTSKVHVLDLHAMMKVSTMDENKALRALMAVTKKKIPCYVVLTPSLVEAI